MESSPTFNYGWDIIDLKHSTFLTNATIFLKILLELKNEDTATVKKNLNRKFVKLVFDKLILDDNRKEDILKYNKVINEEDIFALHIIRIICEEAKLVQCRKKKFIVTSKGKELLSEERAGELFYELFNCYFTKFNIGYVDRFAEMDSVQQTIGYSFCRLSEIAVDWLKVEELFDKILLPKVKKEVEKVLPSVIEPYWIVWSRIVRPLRDFGLLECRYKGNRNRGIEAVRKTGLWDGFMRIEL